MIMPIRWHGCVTLLALLCQAIDTSQYSKDRVVSYIK
nr:MAG TPA: hypothetical protein [Caudoviricetes sp.]